MSNNTSTSSSIVQALPTTVPSTETTTTNTATTPTAPTAGLCSKNFECLFVTFMIGLIVFIILLVVFRMCCVYMVLRRRMPISRPNRTSQRENDTAPRDIEDIGHPFSYLAHEGFDNSGFVPPPPRYDELFKGDEPPPMYETVTTQAAIQTSPRRDVMEIERPLQTNSSQLRNSVRIQQSQNVQSSSNLAVQTSLTMLPTGAFGTSIPPTNEYYEEDFGSIRLRGDTISSIAHSIPSTYIPPTTITLPRNDTISHQTNHSTEREDLHGSQYFDAVEPISQERLV